MSSIAKPSFLVLIGILLAVFISYKITGIDYLFSFLILLIGGVLGATLNYFQFGFSSSFRSFLDERKTIGMRAIIWMLALAILLFTPLLALQNWQETSYTGFIRPLSLSIPLGAFLFGIGMQISCGCTSGTLNRVGQMQVLALPTLLFMVIGGTIAAWSFEYWRHLPAMEPFAFQQTFGWPIGLLMQLLLLAALYRFFIHTEQKHQQHVQPLLFNPQGRFKAQPFLLAGLLLASFNAILLLVSGSPWSISSIFPYWGVRLIDLFSLPVDWSFWEYSMENQKHLASTTLDHQVSLTTIGVIAGALLVSLFKPREKLCVSGKHFAASVIGGLIMGFSAVLASGCNIGAFFSGIASGSLHGWLWFAFALLGNIVGLRIRKQLL